MRSLHGRYKGSQLFQHLATGPGTDRQIIGQIDGSFIHSGQLLDNQLHLSQIDAGFALNANKIVLFEARTYFVHSIPDPSFDFPGAIHQFQGQIRLAVLGHRGNFIPH